MFATRNNLPVDIRTKVAALLNQTLADLSDLYSQTKQAHWNVRGKYFHTLHKLFDDLAAKVEEHIDPVAERITALGGVAHGTVREAAAATRLAEFVLDPANDLAYVKVLLDRYALLATAVRDAVDASAGLGDAGTADLLTAVSRDLDQAVWFLEAHFRE